MMNDEDITKKEDDINSVNNLLEDIDSIYLKDGEFWTNFNIKFVPNLPLNIQRTIQRVPFRTILSRNINNPRADRITQRALDINQRVNLHEQSSTLNTVERNVSHSREKIDNLARDFENEHSDIKNEIKELKDRFLAALADLGSKIIDLSNLISNIYQDLIKNLNNIFNLINNRFDQINDILDKINKKLNDIINEFNIRLKNVSNQIESVRKEILETINREILKILNRIDILSAEIAEELSLLGVLVEDTIFGVIEATNVNLITQLSWQTADLLISIKSELRLQTVSLNKKINSIKDEIINEIKIFLKNELETLINECLKEWFEKNKTNIYNEIVNEVCANVVGESYIKYDGENLYMPTLIFKYKNKNKLERRRYSQIKLRLNLKPDEITDDVVDSLRLKIKKISSVNYTAGGLRCVYVSEKRLFKTTVFTESKSDILNLFKHIIPITQTNFLVNNISYTENSKRDYNLRKKYPLKSTNRNSQLILNPTEMILNCVYLQINGLDKQIKIY